MSTASGTSGPPKAPVKPKHSSQLKEFLALGKKIFQDKEVTDYDQLLDSKKELEQRLLLKDREFNEKVEEIDLLRSSTAEEISKLESENKTLFEGFEKRVIAWDAGKSNGAKLEAEVVTLRQMLEEANETAESSKDDIESLQEKLFEYQNDLVKKENDLNVTKKELSSRSRELKGTVKELEYAQAELHAQKNELGIEDLSDEHLATKFRALAAECHMIAKSFFRTQLPQELLQDDLWKELESSGFTRAAPKKTPLSNTIPAQCLRMATTERIIADKLCTHIFRKYYLPESTPARAVVNDVLTRLGKSNPRKEAIFRLQLLAAYEPDEQSHLSSLVGSTIEEVVGVLDPLLSATGSREGFQSALRKLIDNAVTLWRSIQRSVTKGSVSNDPDHGRFGAVQNQDWDMNDEYDSAVDLAADQMMHVPDQSEPVIPLFPQLSMGRKVICRGCALWSDQNTIVAASIEFGQLNFRNSAQGRGAQGRRDSDRRRLSLNGSSSLGRGRDPSTSPRSPSGNPSFLEHTNTRTKNRKMPLSATPSGELGGNVGGG
ncbi:hypothetical protein DL95DRAFT_522194 [Leptodontidium sp. 2 PMI_412]|nr:hypothetical protein DL95DRAFT_522194 [Leptodontidium sp. 2 PMI_412]